MTRIVVDLIDDDAGVLDSLSMYLDAKGVTTRTHRSADDFLRVREREGPADCIVSDVRMPSLSGLELQTLLNRVKSKEPLVLMTGFATIDAAVSAIKAGAFDFIEKPVSERRLMASIKGAVAKARQDRAEQQELAVIDTRVHKLSPREQEVLHLAARGLTSREIAGELGISPRTVDVHRASVMHKTGAGSVADLVRIVLRLEGTSTKRPGRA
jgi:two-component system, LuxR family, response regulator FixJ